MTPTHATAAGTSQQIWEGPDGQDSPDLLQTDKCSRLSRDHAGRASSRAVVNNRLGASIDLRTGVRAGTGARDSALSHPTSACVAAPGASRFVRTGRAFQNEPIARRLVNLSHTGLRIEALSDIHDAKNRNVMGQRRNRVRARWARADGVRQ